MSGDRLDSNIPAHGYVSFFPRMVLRELAVFLLVIGVIITLAVLLPVDYEEKANTLVTPAGVKAEWYFLWLYQIMKLVPVIVGISIPVIISIVMILLPWIDHKKERTLKQRKNVLIAGFIILAGIAILTLWAMLPGKD